MNKEKVRKRMRIEEEMKIKREGKEIDIVRKREKKIGNIMKREVWNNEDRLKREW